MIFVIGNMRSGTSRIAESLHQDFGVQMGRMFAAQPVGQGQRPDWEEYHLGHAATRSMIDGEPLTKEWMATYCVMREQWRRETQAFMEIPVRWGAKCCALMGQISVIPDTAFVILATRPLADMQKSARRWMSYHVPRVSNEIVAVQEELSKNDDAAKARANLVIDYSLSMDKVRKRLGAALGV